ncbi:MAG: hypothetical protein V1887_02340 [Candidatus Aenigmatarchaeota archaeon]
MPRKKKAMAEEGCQPCTCLLTPKKVAMALGVFVALIHLFWSVLVASGIGQFWVNFMLAMHMISLPIVIGPFNALYALGLLVMTFVAGYVMGYVFALVWNYFAQCKCKCKWC